MLVIERHAGETFTVQTPSGPLVIKVTGIESGRVYLGITAPKSWSIERHDMRKEKPSICR